jgi:MarR family transcriptional regulator, organic hydroperoxide resistance regulator
VAGPGGSAETREPRSPIAEAGLPVGEAEEPKPVAAAGEAWLLMRDLLISQRPRFNAITAELDLSPPQALALHRLEVGSRLTMGELAVQLCYDNSNVTGIVDRLEERGYVARRPDPRDRRARFVELTEEGERARRTLLARMAEPPPPLADLDPGDQALLRDILRRALTA